jgi:hypothetical protein
VNSPKFRFTPALCSRLSYVESCRGVPLIHKTLIGAWRWGRANFALTEFSEVHGISLRPHSPGPKRIGSLKLPHSSCFGPLGSIRCEG